MIFPCCIITVAGCTEGREEIVMAIVITNGNQYVTYTETGAFKLMNKIENAHKFENANDAIKAMKKSEGKTRQKNLYVYDGKQKKGGKINES